MSDSSDCHFDCEEDEGYEIEDEDDEDWSCAYPGECLMRHADHMRCECHTVEDMEEIGR